MQQAFGKGRARLDQVLTVVEHEEHVPLPQGVDQRVEWRARSVLEAQGVEQLGGQQRRLGEWRQLDPHDAVREHARRYRRDLRGQPRLSAAAGTRQGDESALAQQRDQRLHIGVATDEPIESEGYVGGRQRWGVTLRARTYVMGTKQAG